MNSRMVMRFAVILALGAWSAACGDGGDGTVTPDVTEVTPTDAVEVTPDNPVDVVETTPDLPKEEATDVAGEEVTPPQCTESSADLVCPGKVTPAPAACQEYWCDTSANGGTCAVRDQKNGTDCEDGQTCTQGDQCQAGLCVPGASVCECTKTDDAACEPKAGDNLCLGTKKCDMDHFPYSCAIDVTTIPAACSKTNDSFCAVNTCIPTDGKCAMAPIHDSEPCDDNNFCTVVTVCTAGVCKSTQDKDCDDGKQCTIDKCDPVNGCVHEPSTGGCEDGDPCTVGDTCVAGLCKAGVAAQCDDGQFCNGSETCKSDQGGCVGGLVPNCDDGNACTADSCDPNANGSKGGCVHTLDPGATEGPYGDATCSDGKDNNCDGKTDVNDPHCAFRITGISPAEGPSTGGSTVVIAGVSLDLVQAGKGRVQFDGVDVAFKVVSPTEIQAVSPAHAPGDVSIAVSDGSITFTKANAFRFTAAAPVTDVDTTLLYPTAYEMDEGATTPGIIAEFRAPGITDVATPDPSLVKAEVGWGPQDSLPWANASWQWIDAGAPVDTTGLKFMYSKSLTPPVGGRFDVTMRFSLDGGYHWVFADFDGWSTGYQSAQASKLTVWGVPKASSIVINELMWMGSKTSSFDEWIELRNLTPAPVRLNGFKVAGAGNGGTDFVLQASQHTVHNLVLEPYGYFLIAEYDTEAVGALPASAVNVTADVVGNNTMVLSNLTPTTYKLVAGDGTVIDIATFSGAATQGYFDGNAASSKPVRSMERNVDPKDGTKDVNWHTAFAHTDWDGDPLQVKNWGTPRGPNSDIPLCSTDNQCVASFPALVTTSCQKRICNSSMARCDIALIGDGQACDNGKFCMINETCATGVCGGGVARDCADTSICTLDVCDESQKKCTHETDPAAIEGPHGSPTCSDGIDNDCNGMSDAAEPRCSLELTMVSPAEVPVGGGWEVTLKGAGFLLPITKVYFKDLEAVLFTVLDDNTISAIVPGMVAPGDYDVSVTDGTVTATLTDGIRYIARDEVIWGNTQDLNGTGEVVIAQGSATPAIAGRVYALGVTDLDPPDGSLVLAQLGIGPLIVPGENYPEPYLDPGWTWITATYNPDCWATDCGGTKYEYTAPVAPADIGSYLVTYRYSVDGGFSFQYGDLNGSDDGWKFINSLNVTVNAP